MRSRVRVGGTLRRRKVRDQLPRRIADDLRIFVRRYANQHATLRRLRPSVRFGSRLYKGRMLLSYRDDALRWQLHQYTKRSASLWRMQQTLSGFLYMPERKLPLSKRNDRMQRRLRRYERRCKPL